MLIDANLYWYGDTLHILTWTNTRQEKQGDAVNLETFKEVWLGDDKIILARGQIRRRPTDEEDERIKEPWTQTFKELEVGEGFYSEFRTCFWECQAYKIHNNRAVTLKSGQVLVPDPDKLVVPMKHAYYKSAVSSSFMTCCDPRWGGPTHPKDEGTLNANGNSKQPPYYLPWPKELLV